MPRPRSTSSPRPYGRQAKGKTIKSISLDDEVSARAQKEADKRGMSFSEFVNGVLNGTIKLAIAVLLAYHVARSPKVWNAAALAGTAKAAWVNIQNLTK